MKNKILQKLLLRRRVAELCKSNDSDVSLAAENALYDFQSFHEIAVGSYIEYTGAAYTLDESGTPILDKLLEFVKWMYESGFLEFLLKLFAGFSTDTHLVKVVAMSASASEFDEELRKMGMPK